MTRLLVIVVLLLIIKSKLSEDTIVRSTVALSAHMLQKVIEAYLRPSICPYTANPSNRSNEPGGMRQRQFGFAQHIIERAAPIPANHISLVLRGEHVPRSDGRADCANPSLVVLLVTR
jgi:hypothetical protein